MPCRVRESLHVFPRVCGPSAKSKAAQHRHHRGHLGLHWQTCHSPRASLLQGSKGSTGTHVSHWPERPSHYGPAGCGRLHTRTTTLHSTTVAGYSLHRPPGPTVRRLLSPSSCAVASIWEFGAPANMLPTSLSLAVLRADTRYRHPGRPRQPDEKEQRPLGGKVEGRPKGDKGTEPSEALICIALRTLRLDYDTALWGVWSGVPI